MRYHSYGGDVLICGDAGRPVAEAGQAAGTSSNPTRPPPGRLLEDRPDPRLSGDIPRND